MYINGLEEFFVEAPTQTLAQRWLREVHKVHIVVDYLLNVGFAFDFYRTQQERINNEMYRLDFDVKDIYICSTYEQALESALQQAIETIKP